MADKLTGADYIAVEVIRKGAERLDKLEAGLFIGVAIRENNRQEKKTFLAMMITDTSAKIYNLDEYDVVSMEIYDSRVKSMIVFTNTEADQKIALEMMKDSIKEMKDAGRLTTNDVYGELIDIDTYKNFPEHILQSDANLTTRGSATSGFRNNTNTAGNNTTTPASKSTTVTYRDPYITNMTRKGKLPAIERLAEMKDKVIGIAAGKIEAKPLPICEYDAEEAKKTPEQLRKERLERQRMVDEEIYQLYGW